MAQQYVLTTDSFVSVTETSGTIQNVGVEAVELVSGTNVVAGEGITLRPGERIAFDGAISARRLGDNDAIINVVDFSLAGKGGVNHVYIPKGSVAFANLPTTLTEDMLGWTYNVSDAFTTDSQFVEGSGVSYPAGQNVVVVEPSTGVFKYDCFGGSYILPIATDTVLGGVKSTSADGGVSVGNDGVMTINLPTASTTTKGGVKIGDSFAVNDGVLNLNAGTSTVLGGVKSSSTAGAVSINNNGTMTVNTPVLTANALLNWQPATAYFVGDVVYTNALAITQKLVCVQAGISGSTLTISSTAEGVLITDGTVTWQVDSFADGNYTAEHINGIYRGADITTYFESGLMSTNIAAGKFVGVHIGDYITKTVNLPAITYTDKAGTEKTQTAQTFTNVKWYIAGIDSHYLAGDGTGYNVHHVVLISANALQRNVSMNPTNDTTGGYLGSDMWRIHIPNWTAAIKAAFGESHVLKHREILSNTLNATAASATGGGWMGATTNWAWTDVEVNIPNETMIYGGHPHSSSRHDVGDWPQQLPLFAHKQYIGGDDRSWFWLRAVASASYFAHATGYGHADATGASYASAAGGIRPYFLLY